MKNVSVDDDVHDTLYDLRYRTRKTNSEILREALKDYGKKVKP